MKNKEFVAVFKTVVGYVGIEGTTDGIKQTTLPQSSIKKAAKLLGYDKAFSQDWHLPHAFRHEIMIPDDVMPRSWLNGPPEQVLGRDDDDEEE